MEACGDLVVEGLARANGLARTWRELGSVNGEVVVFDGVLYKVLDGTHPDAAEDGGQAGYPVFRFSWLRGALDSKFTNKYVALNIAISMSIK